MYEFESQSIPDDKVDCETYMFSTRNIERHVLHDKYSCTVLVNSDGKSYKMKFLFFIPYFKTKTEYKFGYIDTNFPPDDIIEIFNNNFLADSNLNYTEQSLLCDLK